jgi:HSP20 family protein
MFSTPPGLSAEIRRVFDELDRGGATSPGECVPPLDLYELDAAIVIVIDVPGVPADAMRVLAKDGVLVVAGEKTTACAAKGEARFHLAERDFGRFARAVRVPGPFDASRAEATLEDGILRVTLPRVSERRGASIDIPIKR